MSGPEAFKVISSGSKYSGKGGVVGVVGVVVSIEDEVVVVSGTTATVLVALMSVFFTTDSDDGGRAGAGVTGRGVITNVKRGL